MDGLKHVKWESDRVAHDILSDFRKMSLTLLASCVEQITSYDMNVPNPTKNIQYNNFLISGTWPGSDSHVSVDATVVMMARHDGEYPIPAEVMKYIKEAYEEGRCPSKSLPSSKEAFDHALEILQAFLDAGIPYYSAVTIVGASWVECHWDCHAVNKRELHNNGQAGTEGWANCGEGLFQLTYWSTKLKIINALRFHGINFPTNPQDYSRSLRHLSDLNENEWILVTKLFFELCAKKHADILLDEAEPEDDDRRTEILSAGYLWKAASSLDATFNNVKDTVEVYIRTHERQGAIKAPNGFALQMWTSILLDQYYNNLIDVNKLGDFEGLLQDYYNGGYDNGEGGNDSFNTIRPSKYVSTGTFKDYTGPRDGSIGSVAFPQGKGKGLDPEGMYYPFYTFGYGASPKSKPDKAAAQRTGVECCKFIIETILKYNKGGCKTIGDIICKYHTGRNTYESFINYYKSINGINDIADGRFVSSDEMIRRQNYYQQHLVDYTHMSRETPIEKSYAVLFPLVTFISRQEQGVNSEEACKIALRELGIT